jgi:hypothetical protein
MDGVTNLHTGSPLVDNTDSDLAQVHGIFKVLRQTNNTSVCLLNNSDTFVSFMGAGKLSDIFNTSACLREAFKLWNFGASKPGEFILECGTAP